MADSSAVAASERPRLRRNAWVFPEQKVVWIAIAKNACTSIKWMLADMAGEDPKQIYKSTHAEVTRRMCIHDRDRWSKVRLPADLTSEQRNEISPERGWFVFTVIRDPRVRIWSAWQSKFLQREPIYIRKFEGAPWIPRLPTCRQDVIDDFARFAEWIADHPRNRVIGDPHFGHQVHRVDSQTTPYSKIYDISELPLMVSDLNRHLAKQGIEQELELGRDNDTILPVSGDVFANGVREQLEKVCAPDLERFPDRWDFESTISKDSEWSPAAFGAIAAHAAMGERIRDVLEINKQLQSQIDEVAADPQRLRGTARASRDAEIDLAGLRRHIDFLERLTEKQADRISAQKLRIKQLREDVSALHATSSPRPRWLSRLTLPALPAQVRQPRTRADTPCATPVAPQSGGPPKKSMVNRAAISSEDEPTSEEIASIVGQVAEVANSFPDLRFFDAGGTLSFNEIMRSVSSIRIELPKVEFLHLASVLVDTDDVDDISEITSISTSSSWQNYRPQLESGLLLDPENRDISLHTKREERPWVELNFSHPIDMNRLTVRNRNDSRSVRARGILVLVRTAEGRWTTIYDGCLREREFARAVEQVERNEHRSPTEIIETALSRISGRTETIRNRPVRADMLRILTEITIQNLGNLNGDMNRLDIPGDRKVAFKSEVNRQLLAPRELEWNVHGVRRTFRFWSLEEKQDYIDFALNVVESLHDLNEYVSLGFGSVLSAVRDGDLIPHDDDLDIIIGFHPGQAPTLAKGIDLVRKCLANHGYSATGDFPANQNVRRPGHVKKLDVFVGIFEGDRIAWYPGKRRSLTREMMFPPKQVELLGRNCPVPHDPERYLEEVYGQNWMVPDENFHHPFGKRKAEYFDIRN